MYINNNSNMTGGGKENNVSNSNKTPRKIQLERYVEKKRESKAVESVGKKKDFVVRKVDSDWTANCDSNCASRPSTPLLSKKVTSTLEISSRIARKDKDIKDIIKPTPTSVSTPLKPINQKKDDVDNFINFRLNGKKWIPKSHYLRNKVLLVCQGKMVRIVPNLAPFSLETFKRITAAKDFDPDFACAILDIIAAPGQPRQSDPNLCESYWQTRITFKRDRLGLPVEEDIQKALSYLPRSLIVINLKNENDVNNENDDNLLDKEINSFVDRYKDIFESKGGDTLLQKPEISPSSKKRKIIDEAGKAIQGIGGKDFLKQKFAPKSEETPAESGFLTVLTPVRASKKERTAIGADSVVTPVRRSLRNWVKSGGETPETKSRQNLSEKLDKVLEETGYAYTPNKALGNIKPDDVLLTPRKK